MQAIEATAQAVVAEASRPSSMAVQLAEVQLAMELAFAAEQKKVIAEHDDRVARITAKLNGVMTFRKRDPTVQEMVRLYDQVRLLEASLLRSRPPTVQEMVRLYDQVHLLEASSLRSRPSAVQ